MGTGKNRISFASCSAALILCASPAWPPQAILQRVIKFHDGRIISAALTKICIQIDAALHISTPAARRIERNPRPNVISTAAPPTTLENMPFT